ncbi:hypothetical protein RMSM_02143 [Rhodopirellula maiorica SM1]|uniref:Uncharacterized protein n=1 Tax=Rhodopirellula maiorica SM1 TaxID=1265738 RepID=M5RP06_9BACT|nr:hypothetical protein [Rhodopirellula maiorica]EMI20931.1 hypothetical protein RMSM_02143 [Rhodopirellula maiorica SM1]
MTTAQLVLASPDGSLRVEFRWCEDRFVHQILGEEPASDEIPTMASVNGTADQAWPCSPPIQQLSLESLPVGDALLGVGSAGVSHWSVSVHWQESAEQPTLFFDFACRCKQTPEFLGSTYHANPRFKIEAGEGSELSIDGERTQIRPTSADSAGTLRWTYSIKGC